MGRSGLSQEPIMLTQVTSPELVIPASFHIEMVRVFNGDTQHVLPFLRTLHKTCGYFSSDFSLFINKEMKNKKNKQWTMYVKRVENSRYRPHYPPTFDTFWYLYISVKKELWNIDTTIIRILYMPGNFPLTAVSGTPYSDNYDAQKNQQYDKNTCV